MFIVEKFCRLFNQVYSLHSTLYLYHYIIFIFQLTMTCVTTLFLSLLLCPNHQSTYPPPNASHFPTFPLWTNCFAMPYVLSTNMTGVQAEETGAEEVILKYPGLYNYSQELEMKMANGCKVSLVNEDTPLCLMNMSSNFSIQCPADPDLELHLHVFTAAGVVSLLSLFIIFIVYWYVPDFKTLHGKIVQSNVISMACVTIFLIIIYNGSAILNDLLCMIIGYFGYFSSISMFCWMTLMCFDLSYTLLQVRYPPTNLSNPSYKVCFLLYIWMGFWDIPDSWAHSSHLKQTCSADSDLNPGIGEDACFISTEGNKLLNLFHLPILLTLLFNMSIFTIIFLTKSKIRTREESIRYNRICL